MSDICYASDIGRGCRSRGGQAHRNDIRGMAAQASRTPAMQTEVLPPSRCTERTVRWILSTYELSERLAERLTCIAVSRLDELFLTRFDDQYRYIDGLVDRFTRRHRGWPQTSLDAPAYDDGGRSLQEVIGYSRGLEGPEDEIEDTDPGEHEHTLGILKRNLDPAQYEFVERLLRKSRWNGCVCEDSVKRNFKEIRSRLDELAVRYQVERRIVFPPQPILEIRFHPLRIRFGRRRYIAKNPLRHWRRYRHVYGGLRRLELFRIDQSLYQALRAAGQLARAIPETYRRRSIPGKLRKPCISAEKCATRVA